MGPGAHSNRGGNNRRGTTQRSKRFKKKKAPSRSGRRMPARKSYSGGRSRRR